MLTQLWIWIRDALVALKQTGLTDDPLGAVLLLITSIGAWTLAKRTNRIAEAEHEPLVTVDVVNGIFVARNLGKGAALIVCISDYSRRHAWLVGAIPAGEHRPIGFSPNYNERYHIYSRRLVGGMGRATWVRTTVLIEQLASTGEPTRIATGRFNRAVWLLPRMVQREITTVDIGTRIHQLGRPWNPQKWYAKARPIYYRIRRRFWSWWYRQRTVEFERDFAYRPRMFPRRVVPDAERATWPVDISGPINSGTAGLLYQFGVKEDPSTGDLIVEVGFDMASTDDGFGRLDGFVRIRVETLNAMANTTRDDRNNELWRRFCHEFDRRRPRRTFLVVL